MRDLETVVEAVGLKRFALLGISQGCAISIAYAVRHPERVSHLVLYGGFARGRRMRGLPEEAANSAAMVQLMRQGWGQENPAFRQMFTSLFIPGGTPEQMQWWNDLQRITTSPENAIRFREIVDGIEVSDLLPLVKAPTLVLHCRGDAVQPFDEGRRLAAGIPGATFIALEGRNHVPLKGEPAWEPTAAGNTRFYSNLKPSERFHPAANMALFVSAGMTWMLDRTDLEPLFFAPFVSSVMKVEQSWIDYNGHLNMAYYNVLFDRCVDEAYELLGIGHEYLKTQQHSTFTAEAHVRYLRELHEGEPVRATFQLLDYDTKRIHYFQQLFQATDGWMSATSENMTLHVNMTTKKVAPLPEKVLRTLARMKAAHSKLPRPEAAGRRIAMPEKR